MKNLKEYLLVFCVIAVCATSHAQKLWDDFSAAAFSPLLSQKKGETKMETKANTVPNGKRHLNFEVVKNPYQQALTACMEDGMLIISSGYGMEALVKIAYGSNKEGLNVDLSKYRNLKIAFKGKSNFARVYVNMWSNGPNRAYWYGDKNRLEPFYGSIAPNAVNKGKVITIPLNGMALANGKFSLDDVDIVQFQFLGFEATGVNYAIDKIWFE